MSLVNADADVEMEVGDGAGAAATGVGAGSPRLDVDAGSFVGGALEEDQEGVNEVVAGGEEGGEVPPVPYADFLQQVPEGRALRRLAWMKDGVVLGGGRVAVADLMVGGGPVAVPPWMNAWVEMDNVDRDLCGLRQVAVAFHKVSHPTFPHLCVLQVLRQDHLPNFYLLVDGTDPKELLELPSYNFDGKNVIFWGEDKGMRFAVTTAVAEDGFCEYWSWHDEETHHSPKWQAWPKSGRPGCPANAFGPLAPVLQFRAEVERVVAAASAAPTAAWMRPALKRIVADWKEKYNYFE